MSTPKLPAFAAPLEMPVPLRAGELVVRTAPLRALLRVKEHLMPAFEQLACEAPQLFDPDRLQLIAQTRTLTAVDITTLCAVLDKADLAVDFVAELAPLPAEKVLDLLPDEFAFLFAVCVQVNADFFVQSLPVFQAAVQRVQRQAEPVTGTS